MRINNNRILIIIFALIIVFSSCNGETNKSDKFFEGKIVYINKIDCYHPKRTSKYYYKQYGDTVTIYYKNGNYKQVYNSKGKDGISSVTYHRDSNYCYLKTNKNDSLSSFYCSEDPGKKLLMKQQEFSDEEVLNEKLAMLNFESEFKYNSEYSGKTTSSIQNAYYYSENLLRINPDDLKKHSMSYLNEVGKTGHFYLKYVYTDYETHLRSQEAVEIVEMKVSDDIFAIDRSVIR